MTDIRCLQCGKQASGTGRFCRRCEPDHCPNCHVSSVYYDDAEYEWGCSHGCVFDGCEYAAQEFYTHLLNSDPATILSYAGKRIELLIPEGTSTEVYDTLPTTRHPNRTYGTHFSDNVGQILSDGLRHPTNLPDGVSSTMPEYEADTIRDTAAYAWPYTPAFAVDELQWGEDYVVVSAPSDRVRVSAYRILNHTSDDCSEREYCIPFEYYDERLTYDVSALYDAVEWYERPVMEDVLIA